MPLIIHSYSIQAVVVLQRGRTLSAFGRIDDEANKFDVANLERSRPLMVVGRRKQSGKAIFDRGRGININPRVQNSDSDTLAILLTITQARDASFGDRYSARIIADGDTFKIKSVNYSEAAGDVGVSLQVGLLRPSDRSAIEAADFFTFDIYAGGDWTTIFDSGKRTGIGFSFAFADGRPNDVLTLSTNAAVDEKFNKSPERNLTIYDSGRITLVAADFEVIRDTDGHTYIQQLEPIFGLTLYALLQNMIVTKCGFTDYKTTLPNFPIRRADFSTTESFFAGIAGHIGQFEPLIYVKNDIGI